MTETETDTDHTPPPPLLYLDGVTVSFDGFRALNDLSMDELEELWQLAKLEAA